MATETERLSQEIVQKLLPELSEIHRIIRNFGMQCFELGLEFKAGISTTKEKLQPPGNPNNEEL